jgi:RNA polymerase sigma-70 factor, ECF subfamily
MSAAESGDALLVERVRAGDADAFAELVERYQSRLLQYALGMVGDGDTAADLVQDSFIKAYRTLDQCRDSERFGSWIFRIVRNRCLDHLKGSRVRRRWARLGEDRENGVRDPAVARFELREELGAALALLTPAQRDAFLMKHLYDRSYEEMAAETGASVSALKMRVARAREVLRAELEPAGTM